MLQNYGRRRMTASHLHSTGLQNYILIADVDVNAIEHELPVSRQSRCFPLRNPPHMHHGTDTSLLF